MWLRDAWGLRDKSFDPAVGALDRRFDVAMVEADGTVIAAHVVSPSAIVMVGGYALRGREPRPRPVFTM